MINKLTDYVIRPTRRSYNPANDLGPSLFTIDYKYYGSRIDFDVKNRRNKTLKCSLFHHNIYYNEHVKRYPLMIYCHGNSGNRTYSYEIVYRMLKLHISVLTFDFAGCGNSEGRYIFLGHFEQYDIDDVLEYALQRFNFIDPEKIGIWGRSMGAVAALLNASRNPSISLIILDSPFKDFSELLREYINKFKIISGLFGKYLYKKIAKRVLQKAGFDIEELKPINHVSSCKAPAFFYHASKDSIVPKHHSRELFEKKAYPAEKRYLETKGGHNNKRQDEVYAQMTEFVRKIFRLDEEGHSLDIMKTEEGDIKDIKEMPNDPENKVALAVKQEVQGKERVGNDNTVNTQEYFVVETQEIEELKREMATENDQENTLETMLKQSKELM